MNKFLTSAEDSAGSAGSASSGGSRNALAKRSGPVSDGSALSGSPATGLRSVFFLREEDTAGLPDKAAAGQRKDTAAGLPDKAAAGRRKDTAAGLPDKAAVGRVKETASELPEAVREEMLRAVQSLREDGFRSGILSVPEAAELFSGSHGTPDFRDSLFLCDDGSLLQKVRQAGLYAVGYQHCANPGMSFPGAFFVVQEPDLVDADSYVKMYQREAGLPWEILRTARCVVREFTEEDMKSILTLYDAEARRFLTPPSEDLVHETAILRAYIQRIYPLCGFGHWAVTALSGDLAGEDIRQGDLIGRIGFAMLTGDQEREAQALGVRADENPGENSSGIDADFGFLLHASCRGRGIAREVCGALLQYGFEALDFRRIRADAHRDNAASIALLGKLGFMKAGTAGDREVFILDRKICL